jgi:hypothetical protein
MSTTGIYFYSDNVVLVPQARTTHGVLISQEPVVLSGQVEAEELGKVVMELLDTGEIVIPHPQKWGSLNKGFWRTVFGEKTWKSFASKSKYCSVRTREQHLDVVPYSYDRQMDSFVPMPDLAVHVRIGDRKAIGESIMRTFGIVEK